MNRSRTGPGRLLAAATLLTAVAACDGSAGSMQEADAMRASSTMRAATPASAASTASSRTAPAMTRTPYTPRFTADGRMILPADALWREWPQVGTPLTPNALNGGEAPFPEFHSVYIDPVSWQHWKETGEFRDGTVLAKELVSVYDADALADGSTRQVSGRGYFMGDFVGFEIAYKSRRHFPDAPGNWAYFTFGHHPPPYAEATNAQPPAQCSACHQASAAEDFVFTQFYPVLRAVKGRGQ